jgi:hypothetical protein
MLTSRVVLIDRMPAKSPCCACGRTRGHLDFVSGGGGEGEGEGVRFALLTRTRQNELEEKRVRLRGN